MGFIFAAQDCDRRLLVVGAVEKILSVSSDAEGHGSGGDNIGDVVFCCLIVGEFEGFESFGGTGFADKCGDFCVGSESGDG